MSSPIRIPMFLRTTTGVLISIAIALLASLLFAGKPIAAIVPLAFIVVLVLLSARFGVAVSLIGSVCAAIIFAHFLYSPVGSLKIESAAERGNLAWMVLSAVCLSYFLFPPTGIHRKP